MEKRLESPADDLDKRALIQGDGEVGTSGQDNVHPFLPNVSVTVKTTTEHRNADSDADVRLRLVEAELESMRAKLDTANAEIAAMKFVSGEDLERVLKCAICQDIMWKPVMCIEAPFRILDLTRSAELLDVDTVSVDNALQITSYGRAPLREQYSKAGTITLSFLSTFVQTVEVQ
ncbi:hypothetical protein B0H13DRAFT_1874215 [Mycena leptocephala]|nr:hypothetical protein B0H13DRAFT_1874215 [Mycena leptocephala]